MNINVPYFSSPVTQQCNQWGIVQHTPLLKAALEHEKRIRELQIKRITCIASERFLKFLCVEIAPFGVAAGLLRSLIFRPILATSASAQCALVFFCALSGIATDYGATLIFKQIKKKMNPFLSNIDAQISTNHLFMRIDLRVFARFHAIKQFVPGEIATLIMDYEFCF
jgi:hypothetical protein